MPTNIKVAVRVRPLLETEIKAGHASTNLILNIDKKEITYFIPNTPNQF